MTKVETVVKFENGKLNDPLCKIHHNLHHSFTTNFQRLTIAKKTQRLPFILHKTPNIKLYPLKLFKPPKLSV